MPRRAKSARPAANGRSEHAELLRELWEAAVNLRGSIEPSDYKRYVLPLIFLRFLSARYEQRREELRSELRNQAEPYDDDVAEALLGDEDEYRKANVFPIPEIARWDYLRTRAQSDAIRNHLDEALQALEDAYPQKLKGLLPRVFVGSDLSRENVTGLVDLLRGLVHDARRARRAVGLVQSRRGESREPPGPGHALAAGGRPRRDG
jgi:type I restriction enzyme M protein